MWKRRDLKQCKDYKVIPGESNSNITLKPLKNDLKKN